VFLAIESVIDQAGLHVEVFSEDFLLKEGFVVAAFQEIVEVRNLLDQVAIFERTGKGCVVAGTGIRNELAINPVETFWGPDGKAAEASGFRVP
jgi:hypothetical protein